MSDLPIGVVQEDGTIVCLRENYETLGRGDTLDVLLLGNKNNNRIVTTKITDYTFNRFYLEQV